MENYLKNEKTAITCYRVNENVPFKIEWFINIIGKNLPPYYRIIPIWIEKEDLVTKEKVYEIMTYLAKEFSLVILDGWLTTKKVQLTIVTNKRLKLIGRILDKQKLKIWY